MPADEVDDIVAVWQRETPHLDVTPLEILSRISRLAKHLDRARRAAFAGQHLEVWEYDVLAALRRAGAPYELSPGALVHQTLSTSGTMTNRIDRLERRGLVRRSPDPRDRRGVRVQLTPAGRDVVEAALAALLDWEHEFLSALPPQQRTELADLLRALLLAFDRPTSA
ncbi:MAG: MarR family transcriptional regulator [Austwickia sp.]|nr:MarR family transcriptional regulator [Austwickia sp.]MBK8436192.1 MarR family transcriptional regulator [Austwickia sp.]MBK9101873.1 MarR family transcriptional regulator [Austwickia sp.]